MNGALVIACACLNALAFLVMALDKWLAGRGLLRVPERVLWVLAFLAGGVGTGLAMFLFRHKTSKASFWIPALLAGSLGTAGWTLALVPALRAQLWSGG